MQPNSAETLSVAQGHSLKPRKLHIDKKSESFVVPQVSKQPIPLQECSKEFLKKYDSSPPSFILHIYPTYFKFEKQDGVFLLTSSTKVFLDHLNDFKIPPELLDVFDEACCPYYEGRIIAEIHDHRPFNSYLRLASDTSTNIYRVVLHPSSETLWTDLCLMNEMNDGAWSEEFTLQVESKILLATEAPLCLDPSFQVSRVANTLCYSKSAVFRGCKRPKTKIPVEVSAEVVKKEENDKLMMMMDERYQRSFQPAFGRMTFIQDWRKRKSMMDAEPSFGINDKQRTKLSSADEYRIVRTLRFERETGGKKTYTLLNVYHDPITLLYEGVIRTGNLLDTSLGGNTMKFLIGSKYVLEDYISNMKNVYGLDNKLISDSSIGAHNSTTKTITNHDFFPTLTSTQDTRLDKKPLQTIKLSSVQHSIQTQVQNTTKKITLSQPSTQSPLQVPRQVHTRPQSARKLTSSSAISTTSVRTGDVVPRNISALATQSTIAQALNTINLQQLAQNGNPATLQSLSELTPQQMNHLQLQLLRKKQQLMQRQLEQQNELNLSTQQSSSLSTQQTSLQRSNQALSSSQKLESPSTLPQKTILRSSLSSLQPSSLKSRTMISPSPTSLQNLSARQSPLKGQLGVTPQILSIAQQRNQLLRQQQQQLLQHLSVGEIDISQTNLASTAMNLQSRTQELSSAGKGRVGINSRGKGPGGLSISKTVHGDVKKGT